MTAEIRIGTSGWSYPSGRGTWNGVFYPPRSGRGARFDDLAYYAEHFDTVEINSTFYRLPPVTTTRSWARRTPPGFDFSVKLYQAFTHPGMVIGTSATTRALPSDDRKAGARKRDTVPVVAAHDVDEFRELLHRECGEQLSPEEAWKRASEVLALFRMLLGPLPEDQHAATYPQA